MENQCITKQNSFPVNPYAGGRFLKAISQNKNLTANEKLVMLTLGSELDYRDFEHSQRYISVERFAELTSLSRETVFRVIKRLCLNDYIIRVNRFDENNRQRSNLYSLTPKVFKEWMSVNSAEGVCEPLGGVSVSHSNLPQKELPQEEKTIPKGIVQKSPKSNKSSNLKKTVGYLSAMFKPDGSPETKNFPWPNREQITVVAQTLLDVYTVEHIKAWYDHYVDRGSLGKMRWMPSQFVIEIKKFHGKHDELTVVEDLADALAIMDRETERIKRETSTC
jgi:DNA-binding MarR family transcriptional regulator